MQKGVDTGVNIQTGIATIARVVCGHLEVLMTEVVHDVDLRFLVLDGSSREIVSKQVRVDMNAAGPADSAFQSV